MDRDALLMKLTEVEFAGIDMQLYLNTHPCDIIAIEKYNCIAKESEMLRAEFEEHFGPLFSYISLSDENYFSWIDEPWPWDREFMAKGV